MFLSLVAVRFFFNLFLSYYFLFAILFVKGQGDCLIRFILLF